MSDDLIEINHAMMLRQISELDHKLAQIDRDMRDNIMNDVLQEAASELKKEQARILSTAPNSGIKAFASKLSIWKDDSRPGKNKVAYRAGYSSSVIENDIKYLIIEFGRPGIRHHKGGKDKLGRKIGRVAPFPHIRAAWFLKKDTINRYIAERVDEEIYERWQRR